MNYTYNPALHELLPRNYTAGLHIQSLATKLPSYLIESVSILKNTWKETPELWPILPDFSTHLILKLFKDGRHHLSLIGPRDRAIYIRRSSRLMTVLIRFAPGVLRHAYTIAQHELCNRSFALQDIDPRAVNLLERIDQHKTNGNFFGIVPELMHYIQELYLQKDIKLMHPLLHQQPLGYRVDQWAKSLGISTRGLQKSTYQYFGMNPKSVLKIQRVNAVIRHLGEASPDSWVSVALSAGYYDQSHFIEEFGAFFGMPPDRWLNYYFKA